MKQGVYLRALAAEATEATIDIIGVIGWEVAYDRLREMLNSLPDTIKQVTFDIYSPGGDVWEGNGIIQQIGELSQRGVKTVAKIQVAASMATLIAVACETRIMAANGRWLIHNAWTATMGDAAEHEKQAKMLRDAENEGAQFYADRTGGKKEDMLALMAEERWMLAEEAKEIGFVQTISDPFKVEDFAEVKAEIVAAGKWPQALVVDMPEDESATEEQHNGDETDTGAESVQADASETSENTSDDTAEANAEHKRWIDDGRSQGRAEAVAEFAERVEALQRELAESKKQASKLQSERDKLAAQLEAEKADSDKRAQALKDELTVVSRRLEHFVSGALTFQAAPGTWDEAMATCGNDYVRAKTLYPELLTAFQKQERERKKGRG